MDTFDSDRGFSTISAIAILGLLLVGGGVAGFTVSADADDLSIGDEIIFHQTDPLDADTSGNGLHDHEALHAGLDPTVADTDGDGLDDRAELDEFASDPQTVDTDADGLDDYTEVHTHNTDPTVADTDGDGFDDRAELETHATDPTAADTDGDGLDDRAELNDHDTNPQQPDTDTDGLADGSELTAHDTDPLEPDTDADGLDDAVEVQQYDTDPTTADTDADGLSDYAEVHEYATDPSNADTDADGLGDRGELEEYDTSPTDADSDDDGLDDGAEVNTYGAEPLDADTNNDGLADGRAVDAGADPLATDTDGDGLSDYAEVARLETDPARHSILLELDYMAGTTVPGDEVERMIDSFANAPVENPDGSTGIDLHVHIADEPVARDVQTSYSEYYETYYETAYDYKEYGFHHAVIAHDVGHNGDYARITGVANPIASGMLVQDQTGRTDATGSTLMHELGHSLGLMPSTFEGVDTQEYSPAEYPSVMNYNVHSTYGYSDGSNGATDHDDWAQIESYFNDTRLTPSTTKLHAGGESLNLW